jgi:deazaflavin-dependent oxidoreductase (nitroreductase family)
VPVGQARVMAVDPPARQPAPLPYGPAMRHALGPMDTGFKVANRWLMVPALRAGLGAVFSTPLTGSMMLLRTTGRSSGLVREAPLGYVIREGAIYCCAGFGVVTHWYRNLQADPRVEVVLPSGLAVAGLAERVTDHDEWSRVFPEYVRALGMIGRATVGDARTATPDRLDAIREQLPLVRIRPVGLASGPADPGGAQWAIVQGAITVAFLIFLRRLLRRS